MIVPGDLVAVRSGCPLWNLQAVWHDNPSRVVCQLEEGEVCTVVAVGEFREEWYTEIMVMVHRDGAACIGWTAKRLFRGL